MVIFGFRVSNYARVGGLWGFSPFSGCLGVWGFVIRGNTVLRVYTNTRKYRIHDTRIHLWNLFSYAIHYACYICYTHVHIHAIQYACYLCYTHVYIHIHMRACLGTYPLPPMWRHWPRINRSLSTTLVINIHVVMGIVQ